MEQRFGAQCLVHGYSVGHPAGLGSSSAGPSIALEGAEPMSGNDEGIESGRRVRTLGKRRPVELSPSEAAAGGKAARPWQVPRERAATPL